MEIRMYAAARSSVSVIIPAYNSVATLSRCIESALTQTLPPHEIIVINDGSTDATGEVIRAYADRVIHLEQENQGQGAARNAGLSVATGRFVAFLDADDYWLPRFLETSVKFLHVHEDAIAVSTGIIVRLWGKPERRWPTRDMIANETMSPRVLDNFFDFWARHDHVRTGSNVIRREVIDRAGFQRPDLRISQDLEYWAYLATWGKWGFLPDHLWVGDSVPAAVLQGWKNKYSKRRELCPSIELWEERILPRLTQWQRPGFLKVRGRVAASFALSQIKGGSTADAWHIVRKYREEMPSNWSTHLMRWGIRGGGLGRMLAVMLIRSREQYKAFAIHKTAGSSSWLSSLVRPIKYFPEQYPAPRKSE
jgi:glycosyltransferase involved in cell wall biosynthesis